MYLPLKWLGLDDSSSEMKYEFENSGEEPRLPERFGSTSLKEHVHVSTQRGIDIYLTVCSGSVQVRHSSHLELIFRQPDAREDETYVESSQAQQLQLLIDVHQSVVFVGITQTYNDVETCRHRYAFAELTSEFDAD